MLQACARGNRKVMAPSVLALEEFLVFYMRRITAKSL